jgi:hypothetical protein
LTDLFRFLCELRTYFYQFFDAAPVSHPSLELKKIYLQLTEKVLVSRIFFLIYSYLPVIDPSSPAGGEGYFPQQFQHSTPTTPLREWVSLILASSKVISRQTSKGDIPKTFVTNRTNLRGNFKLNSNLIQSHLRRHLRF